MKLERYQFTTHETDEIHTISGYSVFDAMNMLELARFTIKEFITILTEKYFPGYGHRWIEILATGD